MSKIERLASMIEAMSQQMEYLKGELRTAGDKNGEEEAVKEMVDVEAAKKDEEAIEECEGCDKTASIRKMVAADMKEVLNYKDTAAADKNNKKVESEVARENKAPKITQESLTGMQKTFAPNVDPAKQQGFKLASVQKNLDRLSYALEQEGCNRIAGILAEAANQLDEIINQGE